MTDSSRYKMFKKTSLILLLFTMLLFNSKAWATYFHGDFTNNFTTEFPVYSGSTFHFVQDTIKPHVFNLKVAEPEFIVPFGLQNNSFDFQVDSEISYFNFNDFRNNEAKKLFYQAWVKEKELERMAKETDSLRNEYLNSSDERKEEISAHILKNEKKSIEFNQDIPLHFQLARKLELNYWNSASDIERADFLGQMNLRADSLSQSSGKIEQKSSSDLIVPDTLTIYVPAVSSTVNKVEKTSGITYKIQIGSYKNRPPAWAEKEIKKLSMIRKVESYTDEKGVTIHTTGNLKTWQEALTLQKQVKQEGIRNPSIAAYLNKERISVNEARKINNEL